MLRLLQYISLMTDIYAPVFASCSSHMPRVSFGARLAEISLIRAFLWERMLLYLLRA